MDLKRGDFYLLKDVSGKPWEPASFANMQLFRPFKAAAEGGRNAFTPVAVQTLYVNRKPVIEFTVASDVSSRQLDSALKKASRELHRDLAVMRSPG
jgi:hypothetical protein